MRRRLRSPLHARFSAAPLAAGALAAALIGCSPTTHTHGYTPRSAELDEIVVGQDTRETLQQKLGRPSTISAFTDDDWYYISVKTETMAFYKPEVVDQTVVTVTFNESGRVSDVNRFGIEDGQVIDLVTRTTPTSGRKLTILQQIFANVGRFNTNQTSGGTEVGRNR